MMDLFVMLKTSQVIRAMNVAILTDYMLAECSKDKTWVKVLL